MLKVSFVGSILFESFFEQRYDSPSQLSTRAWGPYYLGTYDLGMIKKSGALFIRKVSTLVDENILRILPAESHDAIPSIFWPAQLAPVSPTNLAQNVHPDEGATITSSVSPPAPVPGPSIPGISILKKGSVGHVDSRGCVAVAESIHCPPQHNIDPQLAANFNLPIGIGFGG
jgi:hypothetical protein